MSWYFEFVGTRGAVRAKVEGVQGYASQNASSNEQMQRAKALALAEIDTLDGQQNGVHVKASGHRDQSGYGGASTVEIHVRALDVAVE